MFCFRSYPKIEPYVLSALNRLSERGAEILFAG